MLLNFKNDDDSFESRIIEHSQSIETTGLAEITQDISYIIDSHTSINNKFLLEYFTLLSSSEDPKFIQMFELFPMIDFLVDQLNSTEIIEQKEIILEIIDNLVKHSSVFRTPELLTLLFSYIETPESIEMYSVPFIFNIFYAIYQFLSIDFAPFFFEINFFVHSMSFFGKSPQIDSLFLQYSYKCAKEFPLKEELIDFILTSFNGFFNEETSDMIMLTIYTIYKKNADILTNENVCQMIVASLQIPDTVSQKYALKTLAHLQNKDIKFLSFDDSIVDRIFSISDIENSEDKSFHENLFIYAIRVIYRAIQISSSYADGLFFDEKTGNDLMVYIPDIIINQSYKIRNEGINVFSQLMRNVPRKIYPFLQNQESKQIFEEIIITILSINENEHLLSTFAASLYEFITKIQDDELLNEVLSILLSPDILEMMQALADSENEDICDAFEMVLEQLNEFHDFVDDSHSNSDF